tara:strand:- start:87 stop:215 length:129 start_codon:yes stop_codon:yes gene_type:complete
MACWYPSPWWPRWETAESKKEPVKKKAKAPSSKAKKKEAVTT